MTKKGTKRVPRRRERSRLRGKLKVSNTTCFGVFFVVFFCVCVHVDCVHYTVLFPWIIVKGDLFHVLKTADLDVVNYCLMLSNATIEMQMQIVF